MTNLTTHRANLRRALSRTHARDEAEASSDPATSIVKKLMAIFNARLSKEEKDAVIALLMGKDADLPVNLEGETPHPTVDADLPENAIKRAAFDSMFPNASRIGSGGGFVETKAAPAFTKTPNASHVESFHRMFPNARKIG
jgi:hypothetical protein